MTFTTGSRLGPYEIIAPIGAGGMGEVWRARDTRLGRDVAVKVLPADLAADADRLRRFEQEARAVAALNHPNILALYDVGTHEGTPYLVTELLEGESLRDRLAAGALPARKAVEVAVEIAAGLASAHERHIIHRDLKPGNVFITNEGHVKILDFGLAKLVEGPIPSEKATTALTMMESTEAGTVLGTVAYMSPEQLRGQTVDPRSDIFSFGCVLYEMLSGQRAFAGSTPADTMSAILTREPADLAGLAIGVTPPLERVVRRCLEKEASQRFERARDLVFALEVASAASGPSVVTAAAPPPRQGRWLVRLAAGVGLLAACAAGFFTWGQHAGRPPVPSFKRITYRRGVADSARFTPDFQSVVYSAEFEGRPSELFVQRLASADARPLGVSNARVLGTTGGDVIILRDDGTLARLPIEGGTPRELLRDISGATLDRNGNELAIVRVVNGQKRLEYPVGRVLLETKGFEDIVSPRVLPDGNGVAFVHQPTGYANWAGDVCVVDMSGRMRTLSRGWPAITFLSLSPDGREVWFSAAREGWRYELRAVTLSGKQRLVARLPGSVRIQDVAPDGRALVSFGPGMKFELRGRMAGDAAERALNWLDGTSIPMLAPDGSQMVFQEWGEGGSLEGSVYHWRMGGPPATRLGNGYPLDVSPDWTKVLVLVGVDPSAEARILPIGAGETVTLPRGSMQSPMWGAWHRDGKRILIHGADVEGQRRLFVQDVAGGSPRPLAPAEYLGVFTADGRFVVVRPKADAPFALYSIDEDEMRPIPHLRAGEIPVVFSDDGRSLYVRDDPGAFPVHVVRLDLGTGEREPWLELMPPDLTAVTQPMIGHVWLTPNGRFYAYAYTRKELDLFLVEGLR